MSNTTIEQLEELIRRGDHDINIAPDGTVTATPKAEPGQPLTIGMPGPTHY